MHAHEREESIILNRVPSIKKGLEGVCRLYSAVETSQSRRTRARE